MKEITGLISMFVIALRKFMVIYNGLIFREFLYPYISGNIESNKMIKCEKMSYLE